MRDSEIEQWVLNEIRLTRGGRIKEVCVFSLNGVVKLNGTVHSRADRLAVHAAAEGAKGVVGVTNRLRVRKSSLVRRTAVVESQVAPVSGAFHLLSHNNFGSSTIAG